MDTALSRSTQGRMLKEMLGSVIDSTGAGWKALILDPVTTKILSSAVKMSDILECNVSVVEDLHKEREPLPLVGVYFLQPTSHNIERLLEDFADVKPLYPSVHIFFSSQVRQKLLDKIRDCPPLLKVLKSLKETNLEYLLVDSRTIITDVLEDPDGLVRMMGPAADARHRDADLNVLVTRLTTLFCTLKDFPVIRYMLPRPPLPTDPPGARGRSTLTQRMATALLEKLVKLQQTGTVPLKETCDMIILDRSYDPLAPFIHEWTYEAMVYDLLPIEGNIFKYQPEDSATPPPTSARGKHQGESVKEVTIDERDPMWVELRHIFIAEVYSAIATRFKEFQAKNKAAKVAGSGIKATANDMTLGSIRGLISALPQFHDILSRMSLHIQMSSDLKKVTNQRLLTDLGELEQDLVLGEKTSKEMTAYLTEHGSQLQREDKLRLLMSYVVTHPERMDAAKRQEWQALAGLGAADMDAINNLAYLGVQVTKLAAAGEGRSGSFFGKKGKKEDKAAIRQPRQEEENYALFRVDPLLRNIVTDFHSNKLPLEQYPYIRTPSPESAADMAAGTAPAASARTRPGSLNWTKRGQPGAEGGAAGSSGRRLIIFILGGALRSEMRLVHQLSQQLGRDIILASSAVETPLTFIDQMRRIGTQEAAEM